MTMFLLVSVRLPFLDHFGETEKSFINISNRTIKGSKFNSPIHKHVSKRNYNDTDDIISCRQLRTKK